MYEMQKNHFKVTYDEQRDLRFVELAVDKETKNHKEIDKDTDSPFMPEMKNSKYCPVTSYLTYYMSLTPDCDYLWQQPKFRLFPSDPKIHTYYGPIRVGQNPVDTFASILARR